ncbi:MAG: hypothetical protein B6226_01970 [Candidatus Cloacimonetes bacterium 4572_65]|nr:MAG: hypothetical protein B6226_01970 [Candidatus Cloacimonetes bacterium 4572_65]
MNFILFIVLTCVLILGCDENTTRSQPNNLKASYDSGVMHNDIVDKSFESFKLALSHYSNPSAQDVMDVANVSMKQTIVSNISLTDSKYDELVTFIDDECPIATAVGLATWILLL